MLALGPLTNIVLPIPPCLAAAAQGLTTPHATNFGLDHPNVLPDPIGRVHGGHMWQRSSGPSCILPTVPVSSVEAIGLAERVLSTLRSMR